MVCNSASDLAQATAESPERVTGPFSPLTHTAPPSPKKIEFCLRVSLIKMNMFEFYQIWILTLSVLNLSTEIKLTSCGILTGSYEVCIFRVSALICFD